MKRSKIIYILVISLFAVLVSSQAYAGTYVCDVTEAGAVGPAAEVQIRLTSTGSFTNQWFKARTGREKEMLAVALTALASGLKVRVWLNSTAVNAELQSMHIQSSP